MPSLSKDDMENALSGDPDELSVHLTLVDRDISVDGTLVQLHCHCLAVDGNGKVQPARLAEFMRAALVDYAVPKSKLKEAKLRDEKFKSGTAVTQLHYEAKNTFTDLDNSGEGGELLLYLLAERFLKIPQILCKMELKTSAQVHYHGADGVYATVDSDGILNLHWAESKLYDDASNAIRECLASLRPFLTEKSSEEAKRDRDLTLLSDKADISDEKLTGALRKYFDKTSPQSNRVRYAGIALVGFDSNTYPALNAKAVEGELIAACRSALEPGKSKLPTESLKKSSSILRSISSVFHSLRPKTFASSLRKRLVWHDASRTPRLAHRRGAPTRFSRIGQVGGLERSDKCYTGP